MRKQEASGLSMGLWPEETGAQVGSESEPLIQENMAPRQGWRRSLEKDGGWQNVAQERARTSGQWMDELWCKEAAWLRPAHSASPCGHGWGSAIQVSCSAPTHICSACLPLKETRNRCQLCPKAGDTRFPGQKCRTLYRRPFRGGPLLSSHTETRDLPGRTHACVLDLGVMHGLLLLFF